MPAPAAATVAAKAAIAVLQSRRGRRMLLALLAGLVVSVGLVAVVLLSSVNAVIASCRADAQAAENATAAPGGEGSSAASPSYVSQRWSEEALADIPEDYLPLYESAARRYDLDAAILAAIGKIETDHGRYGGPCVASSTGAQGPMQFIPSTWANVGVDGDGDGTKDVCDPQDAIPSAANYLNLSGAPQDYHSAVLAYNHAEWYYQDVVAQAERYRASGGGGEGRVMASGVTPDGPSTLATLLSPLAVKPAHAAESAGSGGDGNFRAVFPLPAENMDDYQDTWGTSRGNGRTHEGTDVFAPEGTPIYSVTGGEVVPVSGSDARGWDTTGGWTVMVEATEGVGPVEAGDTLYYAHMIEPANLEPGDRVEAGQQIGRVGSTGEGPQGSILPDGRSEHLHLGWYAGENSPRAEAASGAMNPYPLLEWLRGNGGAAGGGGNLAPGASTAALPDYCLPLQLLGLVPEVADGSGGPSPMGTEPVGASPMGGGGAGSGSATGQQVVEEAKKYIGVPYLLGGLEVCEPGVRMDCTCLTRTVYAEFGFDLPDCPTCLWKYGEEVQGEPQGGDLLVWDDPGDGTGGHAAIAMGNGQIIHANMGTMDTQITPMWDSPQYMGARNLVN